MWKQCAVWKSDRYSISSTALQCTGLPLISKPISVPCKYQLIWFDCNLPDRLVCFCTGNQNLLYLWLLKISNPLIRREFVGELTILIIVCWFVVKRSGFRAPIWPQAQSQTQLLIKLETSYLTSDSRSSSISGSISN